MKETYKKIILVKRAKARGNPDAGKGGPTGKAAMMMILTITVFRPIHMLYTEVSSRKPPKTLPPFLISLHDSWYGRLIMY